MACKIFASFVRSLPGFLGSSWLAGNNHETPKSKLCVFVKILLVDFLILAAILVGPLASAQVAANVNANANDLYWLSFTRYLHPGQDAERILMQIDSMGRVIRPPGVVLTEKQLGKSFSRFPETAISQGKKGTLNLWTDADNFLNKYIYRVEINKTTQKTIHITREISGRYTPNSRYQFLSGVTQHEGNNFLAIQRVTSGAPVPGGYTISSIDLYAYSVSATGKTLGKTSRISNLNLGFFSCGQGISSDGRTAFWFHEGDYDIDRFYVQLLDSSGHPGTPSVLETKDISCGADASNIILGSEKFIVYKYNDILDRNEPAQLFLRIINSETGVPLGSRIVLATVDGLIGDIAVDPWGHFVVFSEKPKGKLPVILFQALDATGHKSGKQIVLVKDRFGYGLDILREN